MSDKPTVALTFDDGPSRWTEQILDLLNQADARATFFVLGCHIIGRFHELKRMAAEGHEIGLHGWNHTRTEQLPADELRGQIALSRQAVTYVTGMQPRYWRSPWGQTDDRAADEIVRQGLRIVGTGFNAFDCDRETHLILKTVLPNLKDETIICLHDGIAPNAKPAASVTRDPTVQALPQILEACKSVTVSELLA